MSSRSPQDRTWEIYTDPFVVNDDEELAHAIQEAVTLCNRVGGGIVIAPRRREVSPGAWVTEGFVFKWTFVPAERFVEPEPVPVEDELDVPAAA